MPGGNKTLSDVSGRIFEALLILYLVLFMAEVLWPTSVSWHLNTAYILVAVAIAAVFAILAGEDEKSY